MSESKEGIRAAFARKARAISGASRFVKFVLIYGGAGLSGFVALFPSGLAWDASEVQLIGVIGVVLVLTGGYFVTYTEDSAEILNDAQQALLDADKAENEANGAALEAQQFAYEYEEATYRLRALYFVYSAARGHLERAACATAPVDELALIRTMLGIVKRDLRVALGFDLRDTWTICVYKRFQEVPTEPACLQCIAHDRTIDCKLEEARTWREGVGVGGIALAKDSEVVAPDTLDPAAVSLFRLTEGVVSPIDRERYRSIIAVPVHVGNDSRPWGVIVSTTDSVDHFGYNHGGKGVPPEEGARALAGIVALAVAQNRKTASLTGAKEEGEDKDGGRQDPPESAKRNGS